MYRQFLTITLALIVTVSAFADEDQQPTQQLDQQSNQQQEQQLDQQSKEQQEQDRPRETLEFKLPPANSQVIGKDISIRTNSADTLADIAERYAIGYRELKIANPRVDPWLPGDRTRVLLPQRFILPDAPRKGIVLNTAEMRLYYYPKADPKKVITFPVSVGRGTWQTPVTTTHVMAHIPNPAWYPPASVRAEYKKEGRKLAGVVPPGPDNPLGQYAMSLGISGYLIHGTSHPFAIGMQVTHGCIRLHPKDIKQLFHEVPNKTEVTIVYQPLKAGWKNGVLYLEAHPRLDADTDKITIDQQMKSVVDDATASSPKFWVNWNRARQIAEDPDGIPHAIGRRIAPVADSISQR